MVASPCQPAAHWAVAANQVLPAAAVGPPQRPTHKTLPWGRKAWPAKPRAGDPSSQWPLPGHTGPPSACNTVDPLHHTIGLGVVGHGGDVLDPLLLAPVSSRAILLLDHVEGRGPAAL